MRQQQITAVGVGFVLLAAACVGGSPPSPSVFTPATQSAGPPTSPPTEPPTPEPTPEATVAPHATDSGPPTLSPDGRVGLDPDWVDAAEALLERWGAQLSTAPPGALILTMGQRTRGGGWRGRGAGENKEMYLAGQFEATSALPSETPPPAVAVWDDGSQREYELISAAEALESITHDLAEGGARPCAACEPLQVTGAHLTTGEVQTAQGLATVPMWEFEWVRRDQPNTPIRYVAVRDVVALSYDAESQHADIPWVIGTAESTEVDFVCCGFVETADEPCGADIDATTVESDVAIVILTYASRLGPRPSAGCIGDLAWRGRDMTVQLERPVGDRTFLDVFSRLPIPRYEDGPPY